jgi:hypothetical protein
MALQSRKFLLSLAVVAISGGKLFSQGSRDTTIILINDFTAQVECTDALADMYDYKFDKAEREMRALKVKYGWHPLPYFLLGLNEWWKIMPDTKNTSHDAVFFNYMDSAILIADNLYKNYPQYKIEAAFFLAAAYGFKGRLYADEERKNWLKAFSVGKEALNYLDVCKQKNNLSPELLFGDGLYNYFSVWIPENVPSLKPLMLFFHKGDKKLGLQQLKEVSYNAFYTRIEAMIWLMRICNSYENEQTRAFQLAEYLHQTYPDNSYFHRYYARMLYYRGMYVDLEREANLILTRIDSGKVGYEATSGRYASFYLGQLYGIRRNFEAAKKYYLLSIKYAESNGETDSGYYLYALIELGEIAQKQGKKAEATEYFKAVKRKAGRKDEAFKDAKRRLKNLEKGD